MLCPLRGRAHEIGSIIVRIVILKPWRRGHERGSLARGWHFFAKNATFALNVLDGGHVRRFPYDRACFSLSELFGDLAWRRDR
jgi:hypothetical protein